ncbi:MAG: hypothetical protein ACREPM_12300, partial [Gemmatimonadaceae bacterium]
ITTDAAGVASLTSWTLGTAAGLQSLVVSSPGVPGVTMHATGTAGAATGIAIVAGNNQTATVNVAVAVAPSVRVTDAFSNPVPGVPVTFTPAVGSGSVTPVGSVTTSATGVATATAWTLATAAGAQSLGASAPGAGNTTFSATAQPGPATTIAITTQPSATATSGALFVPAPQVMVRDQYGNAATTGNTVTATASIGAISGASATASTTTGIASFSALSVIGSGNLAITFASPGLTPATSNPIVLSPGPPATVQIVDPSTGNLIGGTPSVTLTAGAATPANTPIVRVVDATNVPVPGVNVTVTVAGPSPGSGVLPTDASGNIVFIGRIRQTGSYTVTATVGALAARTANITVNPAPPASLAFTQTPAVSYGGLPGAYQVTIRDSINNVVNVGAGSTTAVALVVSAGPSAFTVNGGALAAVAGVATFPSFILPTPGAYTISATAPGVVSGTTGVTVGAVPIISRSGGSSTLSVGIPGADVNPTVGFKVTTPAGAPIPNVDVLIAPQLGGIGINGLFVPSGVITTDANGLAIPSFIMSTSIPSSLYLLVGSFPISADGSGQPLPSTSYIMNVGAALPTLTSPADQSTFSVFPRVTPVSWTPVDGAVGYEVQWDACFPYTLPDYVTSCAANWFNDQVVSVGPSPTTYTITFVGAQPGRWRVRAKFRDGSFSGWSNFFTFLYTI